MLFSFCDYIVEYLTRKVKPQNIMTGVRETDNTRRKNMETARCRAFLAAAETGSFSKAAEALSYTPSGVNQLVTALEKELGFPVFRRNTKGVTLTENGEQGASASCRMEPKEGS